MARYKLEEKRRYIRLDSVFPVNFRLVAFDEQTFLSDWLQGFTNNISGGGICLCVNNLKAEFLHLIEETKAHLLLNIQIPLSASAVSAQAKPIWIEKVARQPNQYLIGLCYTQIDAKSNKRIVGYARAKYILPRVSLLLIGFLFLGVSISGYFNWKLSKDNRILVENLVDILQQATSFRRTIEKISKEKEEANLRLSQIQIQIENAEQEKQKAEAELKKLQQSLEKRIIDEKKLQEKNQQLTQLLWELEKQRETLNKELLNLSQKESKLSEDLLLLDQKRGVLEKANFDQMYQWLVLHQNPRTGLILSFEGDSSVSNWAFTYDQALVGCALTYFSEFSRAQKIFNFYKLKAKKVQGGFLNAYYASDGEPAEYAVHTGPNIWLGIAILQYTAKTKDDSFLSLAKNIADWLLGMQDAEGGIRGGQKASWYATEHNLDAYAFLNMLHQVTGELRYAQARDKVLGWLLKHTYDRPDIPVKRGKGDSTIATDTYAWSIAALGCEKLAELGMSPDEIMKFAEQTCAVGVRFLRPDGKQVWIKGFDFTAQKNLARGGVVSCEWTAQMILSFKILAEFYERKGNPNLAKTYQQKAQDYLIELSGMIISSPSPSGQGRGCLPYASSELVDTGHGWATPKGNSTGSVAATAYTLFAYYGFNPLKIE